MTNNPDDPNPLDVTENFLSLGGLQILVVDDNADSLVLTTYILEGYGAKVTTATSAVEAIEAIKQFKFDIFIFDIAMPEIDGYSLINKVRESPFSENQEVPAIALTALGSEESWNFTLISAFQSYVNKPIDPTALVIEITKLIKSYAFKNSKD
ncbi:response regulator [Nostoc sp. UHCC 0302]|uniref:response regulator n=1 Tax=Nostoc sp. UHCC 0302 TaxID=3134896 RepID=UPI00311CBD80